jgi:hypothetical protein
VAKAISPAAPPVDITLPGDPEPTEAATATTTEPDTGRPSPVGSWWERAATALSGVDEGKVGNGLSAWAGAIANEHRRQGVQQEASAQAGPPDSAAARKFDVPQAWAPASKRSERSDAANRPGRPPGAATEGWQQAAHPAAAMPASLTALPHRLAPRAIPP